PRVASGVGGAEDGGDPDPEQEQGGAHHPPVDVVEQPAIDRHGRYSSATRAPGEGRGRGRPGGTGVGGGTVVAGGGGTPKKWARIWPAIGAADFAPPVPCSTITAMAMRGLSTGAKHMNQPCGWYWCAFLSVSSRAWVTTWAEPV